MAQFLSGRRTNFNVGISSVTENTTSLQVIGNVGIGTTNADGRSLYVIGNSEFTGTLTASRIDGEFIGGSIGVTNIVGTALSISGISTLSALGVTGLTTTKDLQVTGISSLNAISAGGTTGISQYVLTSTGTGLIWQSLAVTASSGVTGINVAEDFTSGLKYLAMQTGAGTTQTTNISSNQLVYDSTTKNLGIGTTNPTAKLHVIGDTYISGILTATDINSASDIRLKTNIKPFENTLEKIVQINGVSFNWIDSNAKSGGIIAQDVEKVFPELVNDGDHKTVNYNGLIGVLIESIKELKQEVEDLKSRLSET
jgi:hypothetical protein